MPGVQIADLAGGALWSATAILAALVGRERTGKGAHVDISMTEGALALLAAEIGNLDCNVKPSRGTEALNGALAVYGVYKCKDGRYVAVGALEPKFWIALNQAIGRAPNVGEIVGNAAQQDKTRAELAAIFETKTAAEWAAFFADKDCLVEVVLEVDELSQHPLHQARGVFFEIQGADGSTIPQIRTPVGTPANAGPPPRLGQHTREVLAEYGLSEAEITALA
jgi:crotonobetainyl-CoA:carnitine CoA-transferase CaiB-like acyl-CoA transferase